MIVGVLNDKGAFLEWRTVDGIRSLNRTRPQSVDTKPAHDTATEKVEESTPIVEPTRVRKTWKVVPLTAAELKALSDANEYQLLKAAYVDLRNGTGTTAVRLTRCERVLAWVLRRIASEMGDTVE